MVITNKEKQKLAKFSNDDREDQGETEGEEDKVVRKNKEKRKVGNLEVVNMCVNSERDNEGEDDEVVVVKHNNNKKKKRRRKVHWPLDADWYSGCVIGYNSETGRHHEYIDDTEDYINIQLDNHRNQLIQSKGHEEDFSHSSIVAASYKLVSI